MSPLRCGVKLDLWAIGSERVEPETKSSCNVHLLMPGVPPGSGPMH